MKKVFIVVAAFLFVACGTGEKAPKQTTKTTTEEHNHAPGETCPSEKAAAEKAAEHNHAEGEACTHEHKEGEACTHDHKEGEACTHEHKEGEACTHEHKEGEACTHDHNEGEATTAKAAEEEHNHAEGETCTDHAHPDPNFVEVQLKESQAKEAGIKIYTVTPSDDFSSIIKTTGKVSSNNTDKKIIVAPTSGVVNLIASNLVDGIAVSKGKVLLAVSTSKIEGGDYMAKTTARYNAAKSDYDRANTLIGDKLISQTDYNAIQLAYTTAKAEYEALNGKSGKNGVRVTSPINGFLTELLVKDGEYVEAGTPIAIVSAGNKSVLTAYVSERYYGRLKNIKGANFKTAYNNNVYDIADMGGKMIAYGKGENDESYLIPVSFEFKSNSEILPGSFVEVFLKEAPHTGALKIPLSAITEEQNVYYVYTHRGEQLYRKNEVKLGDNDGKFVEILSGIKAGDRVVSNGTYQIKLASSSGAIPAACGHQH